MTIDELIDLQEAGSRARVLGLASHENPYLESERTPTPHGHSIDEWVARHDAWKFGWEAEDASRDGGLGNFVSNLIRSATRQV